MVFLPVAALHGLAIAATMIATLRAGSRVVYLIQQPSHAGIGIMPGPTIDPPSSFQNKNETTISPSSVALWELSEAFRHAVRLAYCSDEEVDKDRADRGGIDEASFYEDIERRVPMVTPKKKPNNNDDDEPYSLYYPKASTRTTPLLAIESYSLEDYDSQDDTIATEDTSSSDTEDELSSSSILPSDDETESLLSETGAVSEEDPDRLEYTPATTTAPSSATIRGKALLSKMGQFFRSVKTTAVTSPQTVKNGANQLWQRAKQWWWQTDGFVVVEDDDDAVSYTHLTLPTTPYV